MKAAFVQPALAGLFRHGLSLRRWLKLIIRSPAEAGSFVIHWASPPAEVGGCPTIHAFNRGELRCVLRKFVLGEKINAFVLSKPEMWENTVSENWCSLYQGSRPADMRRLILFAKLHGIQLRVSHDESQPNRNSR